MSNILNLTSKIAISRIKNVSLFLKRKYSNTGFSNVEINLYKDSLIFDSEASASIYASPYINIGIKDIIEPNLIGLPSNKLIDDNNFIKSIVAMYHESRHLDAKLYGCDGFRSKEDSYYLEVDYMAIEDNRQYYDSNYNNMASEIDAEQYAINMTYEYLKREFPDSDGDKLIVDYVNTMIQTCEYKIGKSNGNGLYSSIDEINKAFDEKFEKSKSMQRTVNIFSPNKTIALLNNSEWNSIKNQVTTLMAKENTPNCGFKMDEMMASLALYQYPEYSKILPKEWQEKLSSKSVFGLDEYPLEDWQIELYQDEERY